MKKPEVIPGFKCVELKNRVQEEIYEEIKDLSPEEEIEYFRRSAEAGPFRDWWETLQRDEALRQRRKAAARDRD